MTPRKDWAAAGGIPLPPAPRAPDGMRVSLSIFLAARKDGNPRRVRTRWQSGSQQRLTVGTDRPGNMPRPDGVGAGTAEIRQRSRDIVGFESPLRHKCGHAGSRGVPGRTSPTLIIRIRPGRACSSSPAANGVHSPADAPARSLPGMAFFLFFPLFSARRTPGTWDGSSKGRAAGRTPRGIQVRLLSVPPALVVSRRFYLPRQGVMTHGPAPPARFANRCPFYMGLSGHGVIPLPRAYGVRSSAGPPGACAPAS